VSVFGWARDKILWARKKLRVVAAVGTAVVKVLGIKPNTAAGKAAAGVQKAEDGVETVEEAARRAREGKP